MLRTSPVKQKFPWLMYLCSAGFIICVLWQRKAYWIDAPEKERRVSPRVLTVHTVTVKCFVELPKLDQSSQVRPSRGEPLPTASTAREGRWGLQGPSSQVWPSSPFLGPAAAVGGQGQVHRALLVWLPVPTSSCSYYRAVILICQETQNNCFYSSQWLLMHLTFWEHISGCCRGTDVHAD